MDIPKKKKRKMPWGWIIFFTLTVSVLVVSYLSIKPIINETRTFYLKNYEIAEVKEGNFTDEIVVNGILRPKKINHIYSMIPGKILEIYVHKGEIVNKGHLLCKIDSEQLKHSLAELKNNKVYYEYLMTKEKFNFDQYSVEFLYKVREYDLNLEKLAKEVEEFKELYKVGAITKKEMEKKEEDYNKLKRELDIIQKNYGFEKLKYENEILYLQKQIELTEDKINITKEDLNYQEVKSVLDFAIIEEIMVSPGGIVDKGSVLLKMINIKDLEVLVHIPEYEIGQIFLNQQVLIEVMDTYLEGYISSISKTVYKDKDGYGSFEVKIDFANMPNFDLYPNMTVKISIQCKLKENILYLPRGQFLNQSNNFVYIVKPDGYLEKRFVKYGLTNSKYVEIVEGVEKGEKVLISSYDQLEDFNVIKLYR